MMSRADCARAEALAGAIAIGEAGEGERDAYRAHLAECAQCLRELGGEREIERVMNAVGQARETECWEPDLRSTLARRPQSHRVLAFAGVLAALVVAFFVLRPAPTPRAGAPAHILSAQETRALAALGTQTAPAREGRAESLAVGAATFSTTFDVTVDGRGSAVRCTITKSSGDRAFDQAICHAAMRAHHAPQTPAVSLTK
ncbi:MAG: TonB family protein [Candidatus Cybelea sp.]